MSRETLRAFLSEPRDAVLATINRDGAPQQSPISIYYDGEVVYFRSDPGSLKLRNVERDPRVSLCVEDRGPPERFVVVRGKAEPFAGDWQPIYYAMGEKYGIDHGTLERRIGREHLRVWMRIVPAKVVSGDASDEYE